MALVSADSASPILMGSKRGDPILDADFAPKSVDLFSRKAIVTEISLPPIKAFVFVKFTTVVFLAVAPQRAPTSR